MKIYVCILIPFYRFLIFKQIFTNFIPCQNAQDIKKLMETRLQSGRFVCVFLTSVLSVARSSPRHGSSRIPPSQTLPPRGRIRRVGYHTGRGHTGDGRTCGRETPRRFTTHGLCPSLSLHSNLHMIHIHNKYCLFKALYCQYLVYCSRLFIKNTS